MNATTFDEKRFAVLADCLAVALAASLPWSTSATAIIAGLWLLAFIPTLDVQLFRRVLFIPAGTLPVLFVMLGGLGMLWADVSWAERFDGIGSFIKFLFIPLLLYRFCRSDRGPQVLLGFVGSCSYCIFLDGDCIVRPDFVATHRRLAEPGWFVTGNRVCFAGVDDERAAGEQGLRKPGVPLVWRALARWRQPIVGPSTLPLGVSSTNRKNAWQGARSCNLAIWRSDLIVSTASMRTTGAGEKKTLISSPGFFTPASAGRTAYLLPV